MAKKQMNIGVSDLNKDDKFRVVFINGKRVQIKKGEDVEVDEIVKDVINESDTFRRKGNTQEKPLVIEG